MWVRALLSAALFLVSALSSVEASAQYEPGSVTSAQQPPVAAEPQAARSWYGWQTLLLDFGVIGGLYLSGKYDSPTLAYTAIGAYLFAAPSIHLSHRRPDSAGISFVSRLALPFLGAEFASSAASCRRHSEDGELHGCVDIWFAIGGMLGALAASAIDSAALGWEPSEPGIQRGATLTPWVWVNSEGARLGLRTRF
jgi:hypothetical protein